MSSIRPPLPRAVAGARLALLALCALAGCDRGGATGPPPPVAVSPAAATLAWGDTIRLAVAGAAGPAAWSSSDPSVVRVDSAGLVTAVGGGAARVVARVGGGAGASEIAVDARFTAVSAGLDQSCGVVPSGSLLCWGAVTDSTANGVAIRTAATPAPAVARGAFAAVQLGRGVPLASGPAPGGTVCATRPDGTVACWGRSHAGEVGVVAFGAVSPPRRLTGETPLAALSAGWWHLCALAADGAASCWGTDAFGALGVNATDARCPGGGSAGTRCQTVPAPVATTLRFRQVAAGGRHTCAVARDDRLYCWGNDAAAGLDEDGTFGVTPPRAMDADAYAAVTAGYDHACAITTAGELRCWGNDFRGRLGRGTSDSTGHPVPAAVRSDERFAAASAGGGFTCAIATGGRPFCWGENAWGQLGDGTTTDRHVPTPVVMPAVTSPTSRRFVAVSAGAAHACALADDGAVFCWGDNRQGQLGNGVTIASSLPVRVVPPR